MTTSETYRNKSPLMQIEPLSLCQYATNGKTIKVWVSLYSFVHLNGIYKAVFRCSEMLEKLRFSGQTALSL